MNGGDILKLQQLLGHKSLDMVKEYVALFGQDLKKDYDKFNPLDGLVNNQKSHIKI
jgi:integrase/recombinase XerD